jgi:hypothetical protein
MERKLVEGIKEETEISGKIQVKVMLTSGDTHVNIKVCA